MTRRLIFLLLLAWLALTLFPIYWTIITTFKPPPAVFHGPTPSASRSAAYAPSTRAASNRSACLGGRKPSSTARVESSRARRNRAISV